VVADRVGMQAYLSKALWRAGTKLALSLAVVAALVGIRIVTATPTGVDGEIAELERFEAELATADAGTVATAGDRAGNASTASSAPERDSEPDAPDAGTARADAQDLDRMVRCLAGGSAQYMRAADCATRGGDLEELPPPEPEVDDSASES
jgi:hypothetical protein